MIMGEILAERVSARFSDVMRICPRLEQPPSRGYGPPMSDPSTISDEYRQMQQSLHENPQYGSMGRHFAPLLKSYMERKKVPAISDYGAGKCSLRQGLIDEGLTDFEYYPYDPAFPEYGPPRPALLVACIDVLEHIEEQYLDNVLRELASITDGQGFFSIHEGPARKILPDGRNAHLIQKPTSWWLPRLCPYFEINQLQRAAGGFWVMTRRRKSAA